MAFKRKTRGPTSVETIEELFQDLRGRSIESPWAHQVDLWRTYERDAINEKDVALQLPTGSGKTLVGIVLGEWRRRKFQEKVVVLCPTRQLAYQAADHARRDYGVDVSLLVGSKDEFDEVAKSSYLGYDRIAITTYSGLFNVKPFFEDPDVVMCDDAHAADQYVADSWSVELNSRDHRAALAAVAGLLTERIGADRAARLMGEGPGEIDFTWTDKLPAPIWLEVLPALTEALDVHAASSRAGYAWRTIKAHLPACHLYLGYGRLLIRPFISPTGTHAPFANAKQRIYMSATLGQGGDLERIMGRSRIKRLEIPKGWDKQGIGRRLYFFPERSLNEVDVEKLNLMMIDRAGRSVILVPNDLAARKVTTTIQTKTNIPIFQARDLESTKEPFVQRPQAVVVAANRYEGIDFPGDDSHVLFVLGLPRATHLQERFLMNQMGANALFHERILTRMIQAFGRCTRSATDYAAVIVEGDEAYRYLMRKETRRPLDPEMQAELQFGIETAQDQTVEGNLENLDIFLKQGKEWKEVDDDILDLRNTLKQQPPAGIDELQKTVASEVEYQYAMWAGNFDKAKEACATILGILKAPALKGYRAWWNYCMGSVNWMAAERMSGEQRTRQQTVARRYFSAALYDAKYVSWLADLAANYGEPESNAEAIAPEFIQMLDGIEARFVELGTSNTYKYSVEEKAILDGIQASNAGRFEDAQCRLGQLLGLKVGNSDENGAPDPWWILGHGKCVVFEDHSGARGEEHQELGAKKARQVAMHPNWIRERKVVDANGKIVAVLITPMIKAEFAAQSHLGEFFCWPLADFRRWAVDAVSTIRRLRTEFLDEGDLVWRAQAANVLQDAGLTPDQILRTATARTGKDVLGRAAAATGG
jgi:Helicase C-terminal domain/Type III restriction enzyme, res subunit